MHRDLGFQRCFYFLDLDTNDNGRALEIKCRLRDSLSFFTKNTDFALTRNF